MGTVVSTAEQVVAPLMRSGDVNNGFIQQGTFRRNLKKDESPDAVHDLVSLGGFQG
jgi:hypothetical protein